MSPALGGQQQPPQVFKYSVSVGTKTALQKIRISEVSELPGFALSLHVSVHPALRRLQFEICQKEQQRMK